MTALGGWLLNAPIWLVGLVLYAGMLVFALIGRAMRARYKPATEDEKGSDEAYVVSAVMGLFALLVGFTFSQAIDRYDNRRDMVLAEANAIGTTYLRTQLLQEPHRTRLSMLLEEYTDNRIALSRERRGPDQDKRLAQSNALITKLWSATAAAFPSVEGRPFSTAYIGAMNEMIDMDSARQHARRTHVPLEVFVVLVAYQLIVAGVLGYVLENKGGRVISAILLALFAIALLLVIDIERSNSGGIVEDQQPMLDLQAMIKAQPPGSFDSLTASTASRIR